MATIEDVRKYWQEHPLLSYELDNPGSEKFFKNLDIAKKNDAEAFAMTYWAFDKFAGKRVLDVGCGPGWYTVNYTLGGADVYAVDLTPIAVEITKNHLKFRNVQAVVREGSAESLPFQDGMFDLVISSGVLHHTPDTFKAFEECYRVLKPGGESKITLYYKGFLHNKIIFFFTRLFMRLLSVKHPGADLAEQAKDIDDFIRQYDGADNPVGIGKNSKEWKVLLENAGFIVDGHELHFFPKRFLPLNKYMPLFIHRLLDKFWGTMIYFYLRKPL
ncbi:MAG: class I SAM-dependent methyltransferase [Nitrospirae bacterium]|nr:class I SAM-dependent methyltransferase [Nitrospirota bacterium]